MKNLKITFTAIACFAFISGALALKANRLTQKVYVHDTADTRKSACTKIALQATLAVSVQFITNTYASVSPTTKDCPIVNIFVGE